MTAANNKGLYAALLEVQKNAPHLKKDATAKVKTKTGADYSYTYMTLGALLAEVLPVLHAHGIVVAQSPAEIVGHPALETKLVHAPSGEELRSITPLVLASGADSQSWGGAISYARRYALISMLGLSAEDDDGQSARAKPQTQAAQGNGKPPEASGERTKLLVEFKELQSKLARRDRAWTKDSLLSHCSAEAGEVFKDFDELPDLALRQLVQAGRELIEGVPA